jgi:hypothetical protein
MHRAEQTPGGAGHCFELMKLGRQWLKEAREILYVSPSHESACRRACLNVCLTSPGSFTLSGLIEGRLSIFLTLFWNTSIALSSPHFQS